jgi:hypothetical protein
VTQRDQSDFERRDREIERGLRIVKRLLVAAAVTLSVAVAVLIARLVM